MKLYLKLIREMKHVTQQQLSDMSGVSRSQIIRIESGQYMPRFDTAYKLAQALNVPMDSLVDKHFDRHWDIYYYLRYINNDDYSLNDL